MMAELSHSIAGDDETRPGLESSQPFAHRSESGVRMVRRAKPDPLNIIGTVLLAVGVGVWGVYAVLRFLLGWDVMAMHFLPFHLAGVVPGAILRRRRFLETIIRKLLPR